MDFLRNAALSLIAAAAVGTFASVILPRGYADKTLRAITGIFVVAVICSPIAKISETGYALEAFAELSDFSSDDIYSGNMEMRMLEIFESTVVSNIKEIASELNINVVSITPELSVDENFCINIHKIMVVISNCDLYLREKLSEKIIENLGVSAEIIAE